MNQHQQNRQTALAKYGTRRDYTGNAFIIHIDPEVRREIKAELDAGHVRPSAKIRNNSHGSDRYLVALARRGWPVGAARIEYLDEAAAT